MVTAVIAAGGKGTRMGADKNKVFLKLLNREIILHTVLAFEMNDNIGEIIIVTGTDDIEDCKKIVSDCKKVAAVIEGGKSRQQSVYNGLKISKGDIILIHDGARALIEQDRIDEVIADAEEYGAAALGVKVKDTLKSSENGFITGTVDRETVYQIQTPQVFSKDVIIKAHNKALEMGLDFTDDCGAVEYIGHRIKITDGSYDNIKLTTPDDIITAEKILAKRGVN